MDLFGDTTGGEITKGAKSRAKTVIEHWQEMAKNGIRREKGEFFGDIINPLATRAHDSLWEMGDGNVVVKLLEQAIINDPNVAKLTYHRDVQKYVPHSLLDVANIVLMAEGIGMHKEFIKAPDFMRKVDDLRNLTTKHRDWNKKIEHTNIQNAAYYGTVIDVSKYFALQNIGQNTMVVHDRLLLNEEPFIGQKANFKYENGRVNIQVKQEQKNEFAIVR